ncbi:adenine phosphoribosyltransferase-like isoform X2 [Zonotrichia albicollis]|uniref:adenine phosphoribosyltransferase-like isoform X2 n=1 Tax=Zonotrichia albicollis TaxID=44394 RepID=UPI003D811FD8
MPQPHFFPAQPCLAGTAEPVGDISVPWEGFLPGSVPVSSWPRALAQCHRGCPCSAVAVCDAPATLLLGSALPPAPVPAVPTHGPVPRPCHPGEGLVPGTDGSQRQRSQLCLAGPVPALLPPGLQDCVADLLQPFQGDAIDMVAGIDAMGFILGAAAAATLRKGFLAIRKAGHLCVHTEAQPYSDYSGQQKLMEIRTDAITPGLRILLVDQWVETGGTMRAAIELVERLGGVVAGVAAICMENSKGGKWIQERYKCSHCIPPRLQPRFDQHQLGWD